MENYLTQEVKKFSQLANNWWQPNGPCKVLHGINPCRTAYIKQYLPTKISNIVDIGCGAGILTEQLCSIAENVYGIDASSDLIKAAKEHATLKQKIITYAVTTAEDFTISRDECFDAVICMELLEHVPSPQKLLTACAKLLKPGGKLFFSTINRNPRAYLVAILGAEYLTKTLEPGTHDYSNFIKPSEMYNYCLKSGIEIQDLQGIFYNPISNTAKLTPSLRVNYIGYGIKNNGNII